MRMLGHVISRGSRESQSGAASAMRHFDVVNSDSTGLLDGSSGINADSYIILAGGY